MSWSELFSRLSCVLCGLCRAHKITKTGHSHSQGDFSVLIFPLSPYHHWCTGLVLRPPYVAILGKMRWMNRWIVLVVERLAYQLHLVLVLAGVFAMQILLASSSFSENCFHDDHSEMHMCSVPCTVRVRFSLISTSTTGSTIDRENSYRKMLRSCSSILEF